MTQLKLIKNNSANVNEVLDIIADFYMQDKIEDLIVCWRDHDGNMQSSSSTSNILTILGLLENAKLAHYLELRELL